MGHFHNSLHTSHVDVCLAMGLLNSNLRKRMTLLLS